MYPSSDQFIELQLAMVKWSITKVVVCGLPSDFSIRVSISTIGHIQAVCMFLCDTTSSYKVTSTMAYNEYAHDDYNAIGTKMVHNHNHKFLKHKIKLGTLLTTNDNHN